VDSPVPISSMRFPLASTCKVCSCPLSFTYWFPVTIAFCVFTISPPLLTMSCSSVAASWEISLVIATLKQQLVQFDRHACLRLRLRWNHSLRDILPLCRLLKMVTFAQGMQDVSMIPGHHPADAAMTGYLWKGVPIERSSSTGREASALTGHPHPPDPSPHHPPRRP